MSWKNQIAKRERLTVEFFQSFGCHEGYADQFDSDGNLKRNAIPPEKNWLSSLFTEYPFRQVVSLNLEDAYNLSSIEKAADLSGLRRLIISDSQELKTLKPLESLPRLKQLHLYLCDVANIEPLRNHNLKSLHLGRLPKLKSIDPIGNSTDLESLELHCDGVTDLSVLRNCKHLKDVELDGNFDSIDSLANATDMVSLELYSQTVSDFQPLRKLKKIRRLIVDSNHFKSLEVIQDMTELEQLKISSRNLKTLEGIQGLRKLKTLTLFNVTDLEDISALRGLNVEQLTIRYSIWHAKEPRQPLIADFSGFEDLRSLRELHIHECSHSNFSAFRNLPSLEILVSNNSGSLTSFEGIESMPNLKKLEVNRCRRIESLSGIEKLHSLEILGCFRCSALTDISALADLPRLQRINFYECENLAAGEFLLSMPPTAFTFDPYMNFQRTKTDNELIEKLRRKYPAVQIRGDAARTGNTDNQ